MDQSSIILLYKIKTKIVYRSHTYVTEISICNIHISLILLKINIISVFSYFKQQKFNKKTFLNIMVEG